MNSLLYRYCLRLIRDLEDTGRYMNRQLASAKVKLDPSENIELMAESYKTWYALERARALTLLAILPPTVHWDDPRIKLAHLITDVDALYIRFWEGR
jgi:hypothetical protein